MTKLLVVKNGSRYNAITHVHAQFAGMITRLDYYVGEVLKKLEEKGFDENTIVIFTSDNGPHEEGGAILLSSGVTESYVA